VERVKSIYPAECITWHRIDWGRGHGFAHYDFGGAGSPHKRYGVRDFKAKFGGQLVNFGRYRKVYSPWKLALAERAYEVLRKSMYSRIWKPAAVAGRPNSTGRGEASL
jgi:serine/alanine adding enzyme